MSEPRLSPSQLEEIEKSLTQKPIRESDWPAILLLREVRACWADIAAATAAMKQRADELALLEAIALAVGEEEAQSPATESAAFAAVRDWQKWKREE
jgi:hypothetical protein